MTMLNLALLFPNPLDRYIVLPSFKVSVQFTDFGFPSGSVVNNLPEEDTGDSGSTLGWGDLLEKEMATHSSIFAWIVSWTKDPGGLQSMGPQRVGQDWRD